jgi:hypothetical protein
MAQETIETPELRAAREARAAQAARVAASMQHAAIPVGIKDPLPFCIWTTVALLAWICSPPLTVALFGALGLRAYWRAWRAGLDYSKCILRDVRLVMLYLGLLTATGIGWTIVSLVRWLG